MMCKIWIWLLIVYSNYVLADRGSPPGVNPKLYEQQYNQQNQYAPPHEHTQFQGQQQPAYQYAPPPHEHGQLKQPQQAHGQPLNQYNPSQQQQQQQFQGSPHQTPQVQMPQGHMPQANQQPHVVQHHQPQQIYQSQQVPQQQAYQQSKDQHHHNHAEIQQPLKANLQEEKEHIQEHLEIPVDTSKMSEEQLQFHYFKIHDTDDNNKLDGCELIKSLIHWHVEQNRPKGTESVPPPKVFTDEELANLIDPILDTDDLDKDGYIDYSEFIHAQRKADNKPKQ